MNSDTRFWALGNHQYTQHGWNKKLCWEARDTLFSCVEGKDSDNKYLCPDELYAYEMWCPNDVRRMQSVKKRMSDISD